MRVLVTGGCGFIGSHLVEYHLKEGDQVSVVDDLSTGSLENIKIFEDNPDFHFEKANILDWPHLQKSVEWADRIYHMAAIVGIFRVLKEPVNVLATNIRGCEDLLRAVAKSGRKPQMVIASSSSAYGHPQHHAILNEEDDLQIKTSENPLLDYAISKIVDESLGFAYYHTYGIPTTMIRFFNTIGPRQTGRYGMVVPRFIQQACSGEPITVFGDGTQIRSFCDVRDVVRALNILLATPGNQGQVFNIGNDKGIVINELAELIRNKAQSHSKIQYIPYDEAYGSTFSDIKIRKPDLTKLIKLTGFHHEWSLERTIEDLIQRYRQSHQ